MSKKESEISLTIQDKSSNAGIERYEGVLDSKAMLAKANKDKVKVRFKDRVSLEITENFGYHKKGDKIKPHRLLADQYIAQGKAKKV